MRLPLISFNGDTPIIFYFRIKCARFSKSIFFLSARHNVKLTRRNRDNIVALIFLFDLGANGRFAMGANDFQQRSGDLSTPVLF